MGRTFCRMSTAKGRESPMGSDSAAEEGLPLYEEFQVSEPQADALPPPNATPDEVRDYLASLLRNKHNLADDHVRRVVACWTIGSGRELRTYTPHMYLGIFGREDGWALYRDINLEISKSQTKTFWESRGIYIFSAFSFTLMFICVMLLTHDVDETAQTVAAVLVVPSMVMCVSSVAILVIYLVVGVPSPEKRIERDLQACTRREGLPAA